MENTKIKKIRDSIKELPYGSAFSVSDFTDIEDYEAIKKIFQRMEKKGEIRRVIRGIYDKPKYSNAIKEYAVPYPNEIALAIARNYNWRIAPEGNVALNSLSLSTQVPATWSYVSSGPYKKYKIGKVKLEFNHRSNKELIGMSDKTLTLIQALKTMGRDNADDKIVSRLKKIFTKQEKTQILKESKNSTIWIYEIIKKICEA